MYRLVESLLLVFFFVCVTFFLGVVLGDLSGVLPGEAVLCVFVFFRILLRVFVCSSLLVLSSLSKQDRSLLVSLSQFVGGVFFLFCCVKRGDEISLSSVVVSLLFLSMLCMIVEHG